MLRDASLCELEMTKSRAGKYTVMSCHDTLLDCTIGHGGCLSKGAL